MGLPKDPLVGLVFLAWLAMTGQCAAFVARYGYDLPRQDEWEFVPAVVGVEPPLPWVGARHYEHRFPLARAVYLALHAATGRDFRAGMWLSVTLLSASAATLALAARKLRGRSHVVDLLIPVLLLHAGHVENLTMGYQIAFTLTVAWLAAFVAASAWADALGPRRAAGLCGLATLGVTLGGGIGWAFVPGLALGTLVRVAPVARRSTRPVRAALLSGVLPAVAVVWVLAGIVELRSSPSTRPANSAATARGVAFDFWSVAWGGAGRIGYPLPGAIAIGCVAEALTLLAFTLRKEGGGGARA